VIDLLDRIRFAFFADTCEGAQKPHQQKTRIALATDLHFPIEYRQSIGRITMVCNQLISAANTFAKLNPTPSMLDVTRAVCCSCDRLESCPSLSMDRLEHIQNGIATRAASVSQPVDVQFND
jgi:hypothetical protein